MNTDNLAQCSSYFSSIMFGSIWNRSSENYKIPKKKTITLRYGLIIKKKIPRFEFWILVYTQNRKLGNLGKFYLLKFLRVDGTQNKKNDLKEKTFNFTIWFEKKNVHFRDFRVFDFALYLKSKTWEPRKVLIYFNFLLFWLH